MISLRHIFFPLNEFLELRDALFYYTLLLMDFLIIWNQEKNNLLIFEVKYLEKKGNI